MTCKVSKARTEILNKDKSGKKESIKLGTVGWLVMVVVVGDTAGKVLSCCDVMFFVMFFAM
jgi:hypothetical protein